MAETIVCPVCGETNAADMEFCQNCQSRLHPLTGPLSGENAPIRPGQAPTKKVTSELEPVLPQWLREARQQARQSAEEEASKAEQEQEQKPTPIAQGSDLLAGLASQGKKEEDEETPDWLASITGGPAKKKKTGPEDSQVKWVELGHEEQTAGTSSDEERPPHPSISLGISPAERSVLPSVAKHDAAPEKDELTDWFKQASASPTPGSGPSSVAPSTTAASPSPFPQTQKAKDETLDWLKNLDASAAASADTAKPSIGLAQPPSGQSPTPQAKAPDWLKNLGEESGETAVTSQSDQALPDWLKAESPASPSEGVSEEPLKPGELPDWISSLKPVEAQPIEPGQPGTSVFETQEPAVEAPSNASAFTEDSLSGNDVDAIFASMKMPDWLSDITPRPPTTEEALPPAAQEEQPIAPAELPSWVQAMRPVESALPGSSAGPAPDVRLEEQGPLAGLHGVLPVIPGAAEPSNKPRAHSIKLDATEQQQAHAALLEKILAAETAPVPMKAASMLGSQRALRWALSALLLIVLGAVVLAGTQQIFPLPGAVPNETLAAVQAVEAIPAGAPVLVVFDYEPSTVGEMEAAGASLLDHLLLLQHPHLALLSTSPTGAALAERFMSTTLADRAYQRSVQYENLGYLPGGLAGVYDFAQNPTAVIPLSADSRAVWESPVLQGVTHLSDFAAIIVLTDRADSGRIWIEQTALARGNSSLIMVSSAQAGPMLLPYVDSGQVSGLIAGMNGAAGAEQANGGLPGFVRRYWDAYSLGLWLAVAAILIGGSLNFWFGVKDRRAQMAG